MPLLPQESRTAEALFIQPPQRTSMLPPIAGAVPWPTAYPSPFLDAARQAQEAPSL